MHPISYLKRKWKDCEDRGANDSANPQLGQVDRPKSGSVNPALPKTPPSADAERNHTAPASLVKLTAIPQASPAGPDPPSHASDRSRPYGQAEPLPPGRDSRKKSPATTLPQELEGVRLCQVHPPSQNETGTDIDIIAIHGLDTDSSRTWTWKRDGQQKRNWLKDQDMLPARFPKARIFTCDWPASLFREQDTIEMTTVELARSLLLGIESRPGADPNRPILFIASCLGGIILIQAIVIAEKTGSGYTRLWKTTGGVVFLATPFKGTAFGELVGLATPFLKAYAKLTHKAVTNLLDNVKALNRFLQDLVEDFTRIWTRRDCLAIFYETKESNLWRKVLPPQLADRFKLPKLLVDSYSARFDIAYNPVGLPRNHVQMNKFCGPDDLAFKDVAGKMEMILCEIRNGRPIEKADLWIRNKCYSPTKLKIERLSGDLLPMDRCYINLAIVEQPAEKARRSKEEATAQASSPFSLLARLRVERPDKTIEVTLPTLFKPRKARDGQERRPSRILIRGRAGVGKTTLCKKIIYEFTHGEKWQDWRGLFDRVLWVPLRNLKLEERRRLPGFNFGHLFQYEYFSQNPNGNELAKAMWHALQDTKGDRALFILDGLDEVSQDLDGDMLSFLEELLNQPNVIITSRPHAMLPPGLHPIHLELETIGFYPDQVAAYVEKAFTDTETGETRPEKPAEVQSYLQQHQLVQGLVRIPVQLDALCYTWDWFRDKRIPETMTAIYKAIEERLWKKDILRLEKTHDGRPLTRSHIDNADMDEIEIFLEGEICLLEGLAFTGLHNDIIDFRPEHWRAVSKQFKLAGPNILPDKTLPQLSFLRSSDFSSKERNYHFLHLTFQEYFAARYFVRQWKDDQPLKYLVFGNKRSEDLKSTEFLWRHKYNTRYDIFWRFVAGLLDAEDEAVRFFETIEDEPRDILGPTHQRLIMHCLSEVSTGMSSRENLEQKLSQWLLFECKFTKRSRLATEMEFPEPALDTALRSGPEDAKIILLKSLNTRPVIPSSVINLASSWLGGNISRRSSLAVLGVLKRQHETLPSKILRMIVARLEDQDSDVRRAAVEALQGQASLGPEMLQAIAARLEDHMSDVRRAAVETLQGQASLGPEMLQAIAARFEDQDWVVRLTAVKTLQGQASLGPKMLQAIAVRLEDQNNHVRRAAIETFQGQVSLGPEMLQAIAARFDDQNWAVRRAAIKTFQGQASFGPEMLQKIAARLEDQDNDVRLAAVEALQGQASLGPEMLQAIAARLEDQDSDVRLAAVEALQGQPALPLDTLNQHLKILYQALLERSFKEPLSLLITNGLFYIADGDKKVPLRGAQSQLMEAIRETQGVLGVPSA